MRFTKSKQQTTTNMQSFTFLSLALAAVASAQSTSVSTSVSTSDSTSISTPPYSNTLTNFLTETNSLGVVTGQPSVVTSIPDQPGAVTTQPIVASVYAGLTTGLNTVVLGNRTATVSIGSGVTSVLTPVPTTASTAGGAAGTNVAGGSGTATGSATKASSSGSSAAGHLKAGAGALLGAGAMFVAFL